MLNFEKAKHSAPSIADQAELAALIQGTEGIEIPMEPEFIKDAETAIKNRTVNKEIIRLEALQKTEEFSGSNDLRSALAKLRAAKYSTMQ